MRFLAWNVNHRASRKQIPPQMAAAIAGLMPDVVVLTEYVPGPSHERFTEDLERLGYPYRCMTPFDATEDPLQNHVFVAANTPLEQGSITAPEITPAVQSNFLHVSLPDKNMNVIGLRVPDFSKKPDKRERTWKWLDELTTTIREQPFIILGDFNVDPVNSPAFVRNHFHGIIAGGWQHFNDPGSASWWPPKSGKGKRLDHALLSRHFDRKNAQYLTEYGGYIFTGKPGALSDHAVLVVDADLK